MTLTAGSAAGLSGIGLLAFYRPSGSTLSTVLTYTHVASILVAAQGIVAIAVFGLIGSRSPGETARRVLGLGVALVAFLMSVVTGVLLGWDQLASKAVTTGSELRGYSWLLGDDVEFTIVRDAVVEVDTIQRLLVVHLGSAIAIAVAGIAVPRWLSKSSGQR